MALLPFKAPPPGAQEHANAETERKNRLFEWADHLLRRLDLAKRITDANSFDELRKITFDADAFDVELAIGDFLHAAGGRKADHFAGMKEGTLKRLLKKRFNELKKEREAELLRGPGAGGKKRSNYNWTDDLKLDDKGGVRPLLTNLILFLRKHAKWEGVLGYDQFNARVVIRKRPPWGDEAPHTPWTDHHEFLVRVWFQNEDIVAVQGDIARAVQAAARDNCFHPVRDLFDALVWDGTPRLDAWLITYLHAEDTAYARAIGPRFLISAVARIYQGFVIRDQGVSHAARRSLPSALRQASGQPAPAVCVRRYHQSRRRRISERPNRLATDLAGRLQ